MAKNLKFPSMFSMERIRISTSIISNLRCCELTSLPGGCNSVAKGTPPSSILFHRIPTGGGGSSIVKVPGDVPPARVYFFGLLV